MRYKESMGSLIFDVFNYILMLLIIVTMIYPLLYVLSVSLSNPDIVALGKVSWFPKGFNLLGYKTILQDPLLLSAYKNTILYAAIGTVFTLLFTSLMAYPLTITEFKPKRFLTIFLTITMFFGGGLVPTYLLIRNLHMLNTFWVMVIPGCVSAYNVIIFRTFFQNLPKELRESALLDGANDIVILFKIILPLSKALLATFGLFSIVGHWNSWFNALIYLHDETRYPIQMILRKILFNSLGNAGASSSAQAANMIANKLVHPKNIQMACIIITILPVLCIYPFLQKYFVKGIMIGSIKG